MKSTSVGQVESMLGRRLRPWWGQSPVKLLVSGAVGAAIFGFLAYGAVMVRAGKIDLSETGLNDQRATVDKVALVVVAVALVGIAYNVIRVVVGALDVTSRQVTEGVVVSSRERRTGDFLPWWVQRVWYRSRNEHGMTREMGRRSRYELIVESPTGQRSWNIRLKLRSNAPEGARVRVSASRILGYVRKVDRLDQR